MTTNNPAYGRISEKVFAELTSLDDLIEKMGTTIAALPIPSVGSPSQFKERLEMFKWQLQEKLPDFTLEEILKFDKHYYKLVDIYAWYGAEHLLAAIEYEVRTTPQATPFTQALALLRDLADLQNGPPLERNRKQWESTMAAIYAFLDEHEPSGEI